MLERKKSDFIPIVLSGGFVAFLFLFSQFNLCYSILDVIILFGGFLLMFFLPIIYAFMRETKVEAIS